MPMPPRNTPPRNTSARDTWPDNLPQQETPPRCRPRETTAAMVEHIGRELAEIEQAIGRCRGEREVEPQLTGTWMAHLLLSSSALLHNLLIDTARRPRGITTTKA